MDKPDEYTKADEANKSFNGNDPVYSSAQVYDTAPANNQRSFRQTISSKLLLFSVVIVILTFAITFLPTYFVMNSKINDSQQSQSLANNQGISTTNNATCNANTTTPFPFSYSSVGPVYTPNTQNCSGINDFWDIGNCKQVTDVNWSFGLNVTTNYSVLKIYSDAYCLSAVTSLLFTSGCTSGQSILNLHPQGFKSMKVCYSLTNC
ncbi:hypothetical protein K450DRAFT_238967 [Umbelopsis ramanniana AG]|uniref:Uncharacterized protein n=1 Tax=Umbelopsis ramanniana AG TaxID=1314678 RepID=A0AAD5E9S2_UMBRA|nr:uncharacterized protein K450DRAFT_238967 [Umbelopsis ramanniana AG]KAI8580018.1 hypothetical protein K450DRAFT_238967 [Umbelopsis ramanniana AG]